VAAVEVDFVAAAEGFVTSFALPADDAFGVEVAGDVAARCADPPVPSTARTALAIVAPAARAADAGPVPFLADIPWEPLSTVPQRTERGRG